MELDYDACYQAISDGKSVRALARELGMDASWLRERLQATPPLTLRYKRALRDGADALVDEVQEIAELVMERPEFSSAYRVALDGKRWIASKRNPADYGDRLDVHAQVEAVPPEQLLARIRALEAELGLPSMAGSLPVPSSIDIDPPGNTHIAPSLPPAWDADSIGAPDEPAGRAEE